MAEPLKIGVVSSNVKRVEGREVGLPPTSKIGGGGWSCGARAKHHHRKRLRNPGFFALRTAAYGVASFGCCALRQRQRQLLALRATSRWRGGAKQIALTPREGKALEERSGSSRLGRPRTAWRPPPPAAVRTTTTAEAARASRDEQRAPGRGAKEAAQGLAQGGPVCVVHGPRASGRTRPAVVRHDDNDGSSSRATSAATGAEQTGTWACARQSQGGSPCSPRPKGSSRSSTCAASRTNAVRRTRPQRRPSTSRTTTAARARGARRFLTEDKELRRHLERAAAYQGGQRAGRAS